MLSLSRESHPWYLSFLSNEDGTLQRRREGGREDSEQKELCGLLLLAPVRYSLMTAGVSLSGSTVTNNGCIFGKPDVLSAKVKVAS